MIPIVASVSVAMIALVVLLRVVKARARRARASIAVEAFEGEGEGEGEVVLVSATWTRRASLFGAVRRNDLRSFLSISRDDIRFRVFSESRWSFSEMDYLDVREQAAGTKLIFCANGGRRIFIATIPDRRTAIRTLASLPKTLALTEQAAILRDGHAGAAKPGLPPYNGPLP